VEAVSDPLGRKLELATPNEAGKLVREDEKPLPAKAWGDVTNLQASSAAALGDLELSCTYVEAGAKAAMAQGYEIWQSEASDVFKQIQLRWPHETRVKALADLFQQ
jgi:hypothetical protein